MKCVRVASLGSVWFLAACGGGGGGGGGAAPDPALDASFGSGGVLALSLPGFVFAVAKDVAFQSDGRIVVLAGASDGVEGRTVVVRLDDSGNLDPTFGTGGLSVVPKVAGTDPFSAEALIVPASGGVVLAGRVETPPGSIVFKPALARLTAAGDPSMTFGSGGFRVLDVPLVGELSFRDVLEQSDGKIVALGFGDTPGGDFDLIIGRFEEDGSDDPSYGVNIHDLGPGAGLDDQILAGVLAPNDDLIAVGNTVFGSTGPSNAGLVARFAGAGLDGSFDLDGLATVNAISSSFDIFYDVDLQADGKIVAMGSSFDGGTVSLLTARFLDDGSLDPAFVSEDGDPPGLNVLEAGDVTEEFALAIDRISGRIYVAASRFDLTTDLRIARLDASGRLDPSFGQNGFFTLDLGGDEILIRMDCDPEGRLVLAGSRDDEMLLVRFR